MVLGRQTLPALGGLVGTMPYELNLLASANPSGSCGLANIKTTSQGLEGMKPRGKVPASCTRGPGFPALPPLKRQNFKIVKL